MSSKDLPFLMNFPRKDEATQHVLPTIELAFTQASTFSTQYYRNNRNSGQKNLRCFPECADVHIEKHFCGRPVVTILTMTRKKSAAFDIQDVVLVAEFNIKEYAFSEISGGVDASRPPSQSANLGTMANSRQYKGKFTEIYPDVCDGDNVISKARVEFNAECKGWHYGWVGSRFTGTVHHVLSVTTYVPSGLSQSVDFVDESLRMRKVKTFCSPSFTVASLRRRHGRTSQGIKGSDLFEHAAYESYHDIWQNPPETVGSRDPMSIFESFQSASAFYPYNRQQSSNQGGLYVASTEDEDETFDEMQPI